MSQLPLSPFPRKPISGFQDVGNVPIKANQPFLLDTITLEHLYFQNIPDGIDNDPTPSWRAIMTPGKNLSNYKYTGGEDTISFTLTWYSNDPLRQDVLLRCKWIEGLMRNDGYDNPPHPVIFCFGKMYIDSTFIVFSAPYRLTQFDRPNGMLPMCAEQEVTLKRISKDNPKLSDIKSLTR